jgi:hypothetical protein
MFKRFFLRIKNNKRGQSFAELMLVTLILALLLAGVVEFGFLLNEYLHVLDSAREAARFSSPSDPLEVSAVDPTRLIDVQEFYVRTAIEGIRVMEPVELNGNRGDDIVISVLSITGNNITRFPSGYPNGWSTCANRDNPIMQEEMLLFLGATKLADFNTNWSSCTIQETHQRTADVRDLLDPAAPASGVLIVEIFYNYPQILKLPVFNNSIYSVIPDPIPIYVYTFMPLSAAEPTPTRRP